MSCETHFVNFSFNQAVIAVSYGVTGMFQVDKQTILVQYTEFRASGHQTQSSTTHQLSHSVRKHYVTLVLGRCWHASSRGMPNASFFFMTTIENQLTQAGYKLWSLFYLVSPTLKVLSNVGEGGL